MVGRSRAGLARETVVPTDSREAPTCTVRRQAAMRPCRAYDPPMTRTQRAEASIRGAIVVGLLGVLPAQQSTVEGRVRGPDGEPMVGIEVTAFEWPTRDKRLGRAHTDATGVFMLSRLPDSTWVDLVATQPKLTQAVVTLTTLDRGTVGAELRLWDALTIRGTVIDPDGKPVAGATVFGTKDFTWFEGRFQSPESRTDADGKFTLPGVPIGDVVVRAIAPGFAMCEHQLSGTADLETTVPLTRGGVQLTIRAKELPEDVAAKTKLRIYPTRDGSGFAMPAAIEQAQLSRDGSRVLDGLPDAEWHVEPTVDGFTFDPRRLETKPGAAAHELVFKAIAHGTVTLRGTLHNDQGQPLAGERLLCRTTLSPSMSGGAPGHAETDAQGNFTLIAPLVQGEPYTLHLVDSNFVLAQKEGRRKQSDPRYLVRYEDQADGARPLALVAVPAALLSARLVDTEGNPVPFQWTELRLEDAQGPPMGYATSRRDGGLTFPGMHVIASSVRIASTGPSGAGRSEPFKLRVGPLSQEVVLTRPGTVKGRARDARGAPLAGVRLSLRNCDPVTGDQVDGSWTNVPTDREGRFVFVGVPPGGHRVDVWDHDRFTGQSEPFAVAPGKTVDVTLSGTPK